MKTAQAFTALALLAVSGCTVATDAPTATETSSSPEEGGPRPNPRGKRAPIAIPEPAAECEGLTDGCLLPWPSSRYLANDARAPTGRRVAIPAEAMPRNVEGSAVAPDPWNRWDGFSPMTGAIVQLPGRANRALLADYRHVERSLLPGSATALIDATTNARVAHWAEVEDAPDADPNRATLYVRPAARLEEGHHYVVAIARAALDGGAFPAFDALRDRVPTTSARLEARRPGFEQDVFGPLAKANVPRGALAIAWDFWTASGASARGDLVAMRDDAVAFAGASGAGCAVTSVVEDPNDAHVLRTIEGTFTVPTYLDANGLLARDAQGTPARTGTADVPFTAIVPRAAADAPARIVTFGHGLMSERHEVTLDFMRAQADQYPMVMVATDLTGLASGDEQQVGGALYDLNGFTPVMDRLSQSLIHTVLLPRAIAGACASLPAFSANGHPVADGARRYWYGISQGGNIGPTVAALSPDMDRFVFGVGGVSYPVMITRSVHWPDLAQVLAAGYPSRVERDTLMVMFAHQWERVEGSAFTPVLRAQLVNGTKRVLAQDGLYDVQTPNEGSQLAARSLELPQAKYDVDPLFGLPKYASTSPNAYVVFDTGAQTVAPSTSPPAQDNGVHEAVRRDPRAQKQIDAFLAPNGVVIDACGGPCRP